MVEGTETDIKCLEIAYTYLVIVVHVIYMFWMLECSHFYNNIYAQHVFLQFSINHLSFD